MEKQKENGCISLLVGLVLWVGGSAVVGLTVCGVICLIGDFALRMIGLGL